MKCPECHTPPKQIHTHEGVRFWLCHRCGTPSIWCGTNLRQPQGVKRIEAKRGRP